MRMACGEVTRIPSSDDSGFPAGGTTVRDRGEREAGTTVGERGYRGLGAPVGGRRSKWRMPPGMRMRVTEPQASIRRP